MQQTGYVIRTKMGQALIKATAEAQSKGRDLGYLGKLVMSSEARSTLQRQHHRQVPVLLKKAA